MPHFPVRLPEPVFSPARSFLLRFGTVFSFLFHRRVGSQSFTCCRLCYSNPLLYRRIHLRFGSIDPQTTGSNHKKRLTMMASRSFLSWSGEKFLYTFLAFCVIIIKARVRVGSPDRLSARLCAMVKTYFASVFWRFRRYGVENPGGGCFVFVRFLHIFERRLYQIG